MAVELTSQVENMNVGDRYDGPNAQWLLDNGYAKRVSASDGDPSTIAGYAAASDHAYPDHATLRGTVGPIATSITDGVDPREQTTQPDELRNSLKDAPESNQGHEYQHSEDELQVEEDNLSVEEAVHGDTVELDDGDTGTTTETDVPDGETAEGEPVNTIVAGPEDDDLNDK